MIKSKRLALPMVPRREEQARIRQAMKEARDDGAVRVVFVGGASGTGKSTLVTQSLASTDADPATWNATTKYDQRKPSAPLLNLRNMLSELVATTMGGAAMTSACPLFLKRKLDQRQYDVLISFLLHGPSARSVQQHTSDESKDEDNRMDDSMEEFHNSTETQKDALAVLTSTVKACIRTISAVTTVVLTIDDIHWSCPITMQILKNVFTDSSLTNLLLCATYRTNDGTATEGFYEWKEHLEQQLGNSKSETIHLDNLTLQQVQEMLAEGVNREMSDVHDLAEAVYGFTHGNLFFTRQFLEKLQDDELLTFDALHYKWQWNCDLIMRRSSLSDNVVQMLASRLHKLPQHVQNVLMLASCFGAQFDVRALDAAKAALSVDSVYNSMEQAHTQEFVIQLSDTHYKFAHDMIQMAAYGLMPEEIELANVHWNIGSLLVQQDELMKCDSIFFATVDHLNLGASVNLGSCSQKEKCLLAKVNYRAGQKASKLSSFVPAARYLQAGIKALGEKPFECDYEMALKLFNLSATTEYVTGNIDASLAAAGQIWENGKVCDDKLHCMRVTFDCYVANNNPTALVELCLCKLSKMGINLPRKPNPVHVKMEYQKMKRQLKNMTDDDILNLPLLKDADKEMALEILFRLNFPLYNNEDVQLCTLVACHMINITLSHGWSKEMSARAFVMAATFILSHNHDIQEGYRLGKLAEERVRLDGLDGNSAGALSGVPTITKWWLEPVPNSLDIYIECHKLSMRGGQINNAFQATVAYSTNYFYSGLPLGPLLLDVEKYCNLYLEYNQMLYFFLGSPVWQALLCLTGKAKDPGDMYKGEIMARRAAFPNLSKSGEQSFKSYQMSLSFYMGDLPTATKMAEELRDINPTIMKPSFWYTSRRFMFALVAIANYRLTHQRKDIMIAEKHLRYFRKVVKAGAINLVHKLQILEAEMQTVGCQIKPLSRGKDTDSIFAKYDEAVVSATRSGFLQDAALANYLCFQFCNNQQQKLHLAEMYLKRSFELWTSWGAVAVASSLMDRHKDMFGSQSVRESMTSTLLKKPMEDVSSVRGRARFDAALSMQHKELNVNS